MRETRLGRSVWYETTTKSTVDQHLREKLESWLGEALLSGLGKREITEHFILKCREYIEFMNEFPDDEVNRVRNHLR